ncbi:septin-11-like [Oopsacas minuta]|uniref:Septin n=1 Tax=Oopsacas minuta TaxID=111878 RepID=A0AAV7JVH1_9METZ|nr:septin-11-like [Oopsacas minuta]
MSHSSYRVLSNHTGKMAPKGVVGLDKIPQQVVNKAIRLGFDFNILCIGETGIGKSTLIDTLFKTEFNSSPVKHNQVKVALCENTYRLKESNVQLRLTVVDTVGFGDQINKVNSYEPIVEYVDKQFERYLLEELRPNRNRLDFHDTRIHACLYFISPTGHSLKILDLHTMKALDKKVNLVPIIAKADTMSQQEIVAFKARILEEIRANDIHVYTCVDGNGGAMEPVGMPYAVIGSREMVLVKASKVRGRKYPWGVVEVENDKHCDFVRLRDMLIRTNMEDLREQTNSNLYEVYRSAYLEAKTDYQPFMSSKQIQNAQEQRIVRDREIDRLVQDKLSAKEKELKQIEIQMKEEFEIERQKYTEEKENLGKKGEALRKESTEFQQVKKHMEASRTSTLEKMKAKKAK